MEEEIRPRLDSLRGFGIGLGALVALFACRAWWSDDAVPAWSALAVVPWFLAAVRPLWLGPLYDAWMFFIRPLARLNNWLLCAFLYYGIFTPYGLLLRALGARPLDLSLREKDSYWEPKPPRDPAESARRPF